MMDWSAVAAWGEVAGAAAVVLSLLYLSAQIRQGTKVARATAQEALANAFRSFSVPVAQDPEVYRILQQGVEEFDSLEGADLGRFVHLAFQFGKLFESAHYHYTRGLLDEGSWLGWRTLIAHYVHAPGWQKYLALRSDVYSPEFIDFLSTLPVPRARATASTLGATAAPPTAKAAASGRAVARLAPAASGEVLLRARHTARTLRE